MLKNPTKDRKIDKERMMVMKSKKMFISLMVVIICMFLAVFLLEKRLAEGVFSHKVKV